MRAFSQKIIDWQKFYGRHHLPWQTKSNHAPDPYAIWVSEIMLQQTQVAAVVGYYAKFMQRFPTITVLANATQEEVLQHWSGLGYYSRARNLHSAAQTIMSDFAGVFPQKFDDIVSLAGIGRTTAAAISTFALGLPYPILDGNVKRVFARHFNIAGYTGAPKVAQLLWEIAGRENPGSENFDDKNPSDKSPDDESLASKNLIDKNLDEINLSTEKIKLDAIAYTQGLMDLGATICTRSKPKCSDCPVNTSCQALLHQLVKTLPTPKPRKALPEKSITMLIYINDGEIMLEKRPSIGIWGGLWSLPEVVEGIGMNGSDMNEIGFNYMGMHALNTDMPALRNMTLDKLTHVFTHFKLHITPQLIYSDKNPQVNQAETVWLPIDEAIDAAIPTPVRKILIAIKKILINDNSERQLELSGQACTQ